MAVMGTYRDRPREAESGDVPSSPAFRPTGATSTRSRSEAGTGGELGVLKKWPTG